MNKANEAYRLFLEKIEKERGIKKTFKKRLAHFIDKHKEEIKIIRNQFRLDNVLMKYFIDELSLDKAYSKKDDREYYKYFNRLKKNKIIHRSSVSFPRSLTLISNNPNPKSFELGNLNDVDLYISAKEKYIDSIGGNIDKDNDGKLYIYLRLFNIYLFSAKELENLTTEDIIILKEKVIASIEQKNKIWKNDDIYVYKLIQIDETVHDLIKTNTIHKSGSDKLFTDISKYETDLKLFRERHLNSLSFNDIKYAKTNQQMLSDTPIIVSIKMGITQTVPLTISELNKLYPGSINKKLLENERKILDYINSSPDIDESELSNNIDCSVKDLESLYSLFNNGKITYPGKKETRRVLKDLDSYLKNRESDHCKIIVKYIEYLLNMSLERKIRLSTLRNYIGILDKHLFRKVDNLMSISYDELSNIILNIENRNYKTGTIKNIYKTIRRFFIYNSKNYPIFNNISLASYPKSMIFDDELDQILDEIENRYKKENLKPGGRVGKNMKNNINIRQSLVLFGRYFGLRRNEARSRLKEDVFFVKYNRSSQECTKKIFVDVNNKGMKKLKTKLKTSNSKRRISACIKNKRHIEILSEFERSIASKTKNDKFIFTEVHHGKIHVIDENVFDWINKIIKEVTSRYCTYHSLRHSFATYTYMDMIRDTNHRPYDMYELSTEMGHATPSMTLNKYIHANLVELM